MKAVKVLSGNAIKLAEIRALLEHPIEAVDHVEPEIQSTDPSSVVLEKLNCATARALSESGFVVLAEDTALHLAGWNGLPGALVSWFVDDMGPEARETHRRKPALRPRDSRKCRWGSLRRKGGHLDRETERPDRTPEGRPGRLDTNL